ncbi:MAG: erythromycin esterase family protein [Proteobacteria bacterium]|nr:erythromycin esterase family protein [Pseudomonadota bacterium]
MQSKTLRLVLLGVAWAAGGAAWAEADVVSDGSSTQREAFVQWARKRAVPVDDSVHEWTSMDALVGSARVVALGETAHGAHEPLAFRNRLFEHLIDERGFTAIALETGLCESQRVHDFVLGGAGDAKQVAHEGFSWGFGEFGENVELIQWLRQYNADAHHARKIHFYGIDMCGGDNAEFRSARVAFERVMTFLEHVAPEQAARSHREADSLLGHLTSQTYRQLTPIERERLRALVGGWLALFPSERAKFIAASSQSEFEWALRDVIMAQQIEAALAAWPLDNPPDGVSPDLYKVVNIRDTAMAENVKWVLEQEGAAGRLLLFAHNAHIMNATTRGGMWKIYREQPVAMGRHLRRLLGPAMVIMGVSSAHTGGGLPTMKLASDGIDSTLAELRLARFFLDLRGPTPALVGRWLNEPKPLSIGYVTENIVVPREAFDALVYFDELTPSR